MAKGKVKWFNERKGYGFITPDEGGEDCFVHYSGVEGQGFKNLVEGDDVEFETENDDRGRARAVKVKKL